MDKRPKLVAERSDYESSDGELKVIPITKRSIGKNPGSSPERRQIAIDYVDIRVSEKNKKLANIYGGSVEEQGNQINPTI